MLDFTVTRSLTSTVAYNKKDLVHFHLTGVGVGVNQAHARTGSMYGKSKTGITNPSGKDLSLSRSVAEYDLHCSRLLMKPVHYAIHLMEHGPPNRRTRDSLVLLDRVCRQASQALSLLIYQSDICIISSNRATVKSDSKLGSFAPGRAKGTTQLVLPEIKLEGD